MFKTSNPILNKKTFGDARTIDSANVMTINGTINKVIISILLVFIGAMYVWNIAASFPVEGMRSAVQPYMYGGMIGGLVTFFIVMFAPSIRMITVPIYALLEGLFLGGLSAFFEVMFPGIVIQAVGLTFFVLFAMLFAYRTGMIKVTKKFAAGVFAATAGIFLLYLVSWILSIFGVNLGILGGTSMISLGITAFIAVIAALNLVLDFEMIVQGAKAKAPKSMEWYGAFGLLVTLVWLYITLLRLLAIIASRD